MIKKLVHFSDLHIRLFKDHDLYKSILDTVSRNKLGITPIQPYLEKINGTMSDVFM